MQNPDMFSQALGLGVFGAASSFVALLLLWSLFWKGLALWHSARRGEQWWFLIFLIVNLAGVLEIIYLFGVIKRTPNTLFSKQH